MSYYQNPNYYGNSFPYPQQMQPFVPQQAPQVLNGKIVDSIDVVKAAEVPIGGYGVFPKADLSEVYIKTWNNNGTTNITTFKVSSQPTLSPNDILLDKVSKLEQKLDTLLNKSIKKEDEKNEF